MRSASEAEKRQRFAFTLFEMLVCLSIILLVISLLLPAIHSARELARRAQCSNNLHQFGIAMHTYLSSTSTFPGASNGNGYSLHSAILGHLGEVPLYNSINFDLESHISPIGRNYGNYTSLNVSVGVLICPSDSKPSWDAGGWTSYAGSRGTGGPGASSDGAFPSVGGRPAYLSGFTDGTSSTVALAEWSLGGSDYRKRDRWRQIYKTRIKVSDDINGTFASQCRSLNHNTAEISSTTKGKVWIRGDYIDSLYNHHLGINENSCTNSGLVQEGAYSAGSQHFGGANVLFADGHVSFVKESVSLAVWRSLGTKDGRELISSDLHW